MIDWLIEYLVFYIVSIVFQAYNGSELLDVFLKWCVVHYEYKNSQNFDKIIRLFIFNFEGY